MPVMQIVEKPLKNDTGGVNNYICFKQIIF